MFFEIIYIYAKIYSTPVVRLPTRFNSLIRLAKSRSFIVRSKKSRMENDGESDSCHLQGFESYQVFWRENQWTIPLLDKLLNEEYSLAQVERAS